VNQAAGTLTQMDFLRYVPLGLLVLILAGAFAAAGITAVPALRVRDYGRAARGALRTLLVGAVISVLAVTLVPTNLYSGVNVIPFRGIARQLANVNGPVGALNIVGNAVMFLPVGLLAALALGWRVRTATAALFALSLSIEVAQLMLGRAADVDDVILNTAGAAAGAALGRAVLVRVAAGRVAPATRRARTSL